MSRKGQLPNATPIVASRVEGTKIAVPVADRILLRVGGAAAVLAFASQLWQEVSQTLTGTAVETAYPVLGNAAYASQITLVCFVVVGVHLAHPPTVTRRDDSGGSPPRSRSSAPLFGLARRGLSSGTRSHQALPMCSFLLSRTNRSYF